MGKWIAFAVLSVISLGAGQPAVAAGETVHILGCVKPGVEGGCLMIADRKTGKLYQINSANPRPDPAQDLAVVLTGTISPGLDFCMQGPILKDITWSYTKMPCKTGK
jgi:hypothetical protein